MAQIRVRRTEAEPDLSGGLMQRGTMIRIATYEFISNAIREGSFRGSLLLEPLRAIDSRRAC